MPASSTYKIALSMVPSTVVALTEGRYFLCAMFADDERRCAVVRHSV
ncbi:hypothetical protein QO004_004123 [Rhizobium mesoamericanum]|nr:hypothetical protein [Rhizobium mesoamericanum]